MEAKLFELIGNSDGRGLLVAVESNVSIPFAIKRVYFLTDLSKKHPRGFHAHKKLKQFAVCVSGSCRFLLDDGKKKSFVFLDRPTQGILIEEMCWHEMDQFSEDCVLLVLASDYYDESDYIREYDRFSVLANELNLEK